VLTQEQMQKSKGNTPQHSDVNTIIFPQTDETMTSRTANMARLMYFFQKIIHLSNNPTIKDAWIRQQNHKVIKLLLSW
jgi:hypothetical protein